MKRTARAKGAGKSKWLEVFEKLQKELRDGVYPQGVPLPSEGTVVRRFGVSRITAVRAMEELRKCPTISWPARSAPASAASTRPDLTKPLNRIAN